MRCRPSLITLANAKLQTAAGLVCLAAVVLAFGMASLKQAMFRRFLIQLSVQSSDPPSGGHL